MIFFIQLKVAIEIYNNNKIITKIKEIPLERTDSKTRLNNSINIFSKQRI